MCVTRSVQVHPGLQKPLPKGKVILTTPTVQQKVEPRGLPNPRAESVSDHSETATKKRKTVVRRPKPVSFENEQF